MKRRVSIKSNVARVPGFPIVHVTLLIVAWALCARAIHAETQVVTCSTPPVAIAPSTTQGAALGKLTTDPTQKDVKVFELPSKVRFSVVNQTSQPVQTLAFSSLGFEDGKTDQIIPTPHWAPFDFGSTPLRANQRTDCTIPIPMSNHAGAFTGILRIDDENGFEAIVPLTIRIRGPYFPVWRDLPLIFLTVVFIAGWGLSMGLDYWFTVKWPLLQQVMVLKQVQTALGTFLTNLVKWEKDNHITLIDADIAATYDKSDLDTLLSDLTGKTVADMQQAVDRFTTSSALNDEFYTAIQLAVAKIAPANRDAVTKQLDAVSRNQTVIAYRTALLAVLTVATAALPPAEVVPAAPVLQPGTDLSTTTAANLHKRAVLMDWLKTIVLGVVVWLTAYTVYYAPNPSFGTALDYIALFLWCLGLTATGSQIISSVRKP